MQGSLFLLLVASGREPVQQFVLSNNATDSELETQHQSSLHHELMEWIWSCHLTPLPDFPKKIKEEVGIAIFSHKEIVKIDRFACS